LKAIPIKAGILVTYMSLSA
jgi:hypothetical protein